MQEKQTSKPIVLTLAGSDPSGGAGLQADLRVAQHLGCFGMAVPTALTVQNTMGVRKVWPLTGEQIVEQAYAVFDDILPNAIKVGMLGNEHVAQGVLDVLNRYENECLSKAKEQQPSLKANIVVDTILNATSGVSLFESNDDSALLKLLAKARIVTPNLPEAAHLLANNINKVEDSARRLSEMCNGASIYLKGGHQEGEILTDIFYNAEDDTFLKMEQPKVDTQNTHGTGCTLSSALASFLAQGKLLNDSALLANDFIHKALTNGKAFVLGQGHGPAFID